MYGTKQLPKWASGDDLALDIYDEIIAAMPSDELAVKALYSKANVLWEKQDFKDSIDSFLLLTKRFPKHELAPDSYLAVIKVYLEQSEVEFQNPDLLALAQIYLKKFKQEFPRETKIAEAEEALHQIKEVHAKGLYDTAQFYERMGQPRASIIYYSKAVAQFPETDVAKLSQQRLYVLRPSSPKTTETTSQAKAKAVIQTPIN